MFDLYQMSHLTLGDGIMWMSWKRYYRIMVNCSVARKVIMTYLTSLKITSILT